MRLIVSLENNSEGKVLANVDMEEIVKMTITDDIEKSNFNPKMLKACTDTSHICGYLQGREDTIKKIIELAHEDATTGNMVINLADVEKLKNSKEKTE